MEKSSQKMKGVNDTKSMNNGAPKTKEIEAPAASETMHFDEKIEKALGIVRNGSKNVHLNNMYVIDNMIYKCYI